MWGVRRIPDRVVGEGGVVKDNSCELLVNLLDPLLYSGEATVVVLVSPRQICRP